MFCLRLSVPGEFGSGNASDLSALLSNAVAFEMDTVCMCVRRRVAVCDVAVQTRRSDSVCAFYVACDNVGNARFSRIPGFSNAFTTGMAPIISSWIQPGDMTGASKCARIGGPYGFDVCASSLSPGHGT